MNHMENFRAIDDRFRRDALIESSQLALMRVSQRQQITVGDVRRVEKTRRVQVFAVQRRYIVRPEGMSGQFSKRSQQIGHSRGRAGRIRISRMADDAQNSVFCQRTRGPSLMSFRRKPGVRAVVQNVGRIDQGDQDVHVQKAPRHRSSSRSRCTSSEVTRGAPLRTLRSGTPFRVLALVSAGERARLANEEITSPTDICSTAAISLAALRTSSSIASVVRINA
jgi:hypothetical protein